MANLLGKIGNRQGLSGPWVDDPTWMDTVDAPPPIPQMNMAPLRPLALPESPRPQVTTPLMDREATVNADLAKRTTPSAPAQGVLGKIGHTAASIGNVLGAIFPGIASGIKGSAQYNERMIGRDRDELDQISDLKTENQQRLQSEATTDFTRQRPEIMKAQLGQKTQTAREKYAADLRKKGINVTGFDQETGLPTTEDDPETMAYQHSAAENYIHTANAEKAEILARIAKNKFMPGTPEYDQEQRKLSQIDRKINIAQNNLGMRQAEYDAHAYGTDSGGQALPGTMLMDDGTPVGTWNAQNVRPTTEQRNAGGRADVVRQLGQHLAQDIEDPEIREYLGPGSGRIAEIEARGGVLPEKVARFRNDLISYGAFQAGFHPVRGIGALQYFEKVMGGLGQTPESLKGKLLSNENTGEMVQQTGTPKVAKGGESKQDSNRKFTVDGRTFNIPAGQVKEFLKDHPNAR